MSASSPQEQVGIYHFRNTLNETLLGQTGLHHFGNSLECITSGTGGTVPLMERVRIHHLRNSLE